MHKIKVADRSLLFVYGTLKRGYNMERIAPDAVFECEATLFGFEIYNLGSYPGIKRVDHPINDGDPTPYVHGEVWSVSDSGLARLDRYEGSAYTKIQVEVDLDDNNGLGEDETTFVSTYLYLGNVDKLQPIPDGEWNR